MFSHGLVEVSLDGRGRRGTRLELGVCEPELIGERVGTRWRGACRWRPANISDPTWHDVL
jgi:hypothetical protein